MVVPDVDDHVGAGWHVAVGAKPTRIAGRVMMVFRTPEFRKCVASAANPIALRQFSGMRIVAVRAGYATTIHFALNERSVLIIFLKDLTVRIVDAFSQKAWHVCVQKWLTRPIIIRDRMPP